MAAGIHFIPQILCFISEKIYVLIPVSQGIFIKSLSIRQRYWFDNLWKRAEREFHFKVILTQTANICLNKIDYMFYLMLYLKQVENIWYFLINKDSFLVN